MITKEKFQRYEEVRKSGVTNMLNINYVCELSELTRDEVFEIMRDYSKLKEGQIE